MYEADPAQVECFPAARSGAPSWNGSPVHLRHLAIHEDHLVRVTERDRPLLSGDGLTAFTWTGEAAVLRDRLEATAAGGTTEVLYQPGGPDIERELRAFMTMAST